MDYLQTISHIAGVILAVRALYFGWRGEYQKGTFDMAFAIFAFVA